MSQTYSMIDVPDCDAAADNAAALVAAGYHHIGAYLDNGSEYKTRLSASNAALLKAGGITTVYPIWENGFPTTPGYFTADRGTQDGLDAAWWAVQAGIPSGVHIIGTADLDVSPGDLAAVVGYWTEFRKGLMASGYLSGGYGSGFVLDRLTTLGLISLSMLSGSTGWAGYQSFKAKADIVQDVLDTTVGRFGKNAAGIGCDTDTVVVDGGGWVL